MIAKRNSWDLKHLYIVWFIEIGLGNVQENQSYLKHNDFTFSFLLSWAKKKRRKYEIP